MAGREVEIVYLSRTACIERPFISKVLIQDEIRLN